MAKMCSPEEFPPSPFSDPEWEDFMTTAGMQTAITNEMFVKFAKIVEQDGRNGITEEITMKSNMLLDHLFSTEDFLDKNLAYHISSIRFIIPSTPPEYMLSIVEQFESGKLTSFSLSYPEIHREIVWSTGHILPDLANKFFHLDTMMLNERESEILKSLKIKEKPPVEIVLKHFQNVTDSLHQYYESVRCDQQLAKRCILAKHMDIMSKLYNFIQHKGFHCQVEYMLQKKPILLLPEFKKLITCDKAVIMLKEKNKIEPYLYPAPVEFGRYFDLFTFLGTSRDLSSQNYANVLKCLYDDVGREHLNPNELQIAKRAVYKFFKLQPKQEKTVRDTLDTLYLPSEKQILVNSTDLVYNDDETLQKMLNNEKGLVYFAGFEKLEIKKLSGSVSIRTLPSSIRPKILSELVERRLKTLYPERVVNSEKAFGYQRFVQSKEFIDGIIRLVVDEIHHTGKDKDLKKLNELKIKENLNNITFTEVVDLTVSLTYKNKLIGDESISCTFTERDNHLESEWIFYFSGNDDEFGNKFAELMEICSGITLTKNKHYVTLMLLYFLDNPKGIERFLSKNGILDYKISTGDSFFPCLGSPVHPDWHQTLLSTFDHFSPGEYVALQVFEEELGEGNILTSEYKHARIVAEIEEDMDNKPEVQLVLLKYKVHVGEEQYEIIPAYKIYKYVRSNTSKSKAVKPVVPGSSLSASNVSGCSFEECQNINRFLKTVWELHHDERRLIIKRLLRQWHPDKNVGNEIYAKEIFQHISFTIVRLENGEDIDEDEEKRNEPTGNTHPWSNEVNVFVSKERQHQQRQQQNENEPVDEPVSMPGTARTWCSQARNDIAAAKEFIKYADRVKAYNWICYHCHQSAEKSIKAVWFYKDADNVLLRSHDLKKMSDIDRLELPGLAPLADELQSLLGENTSMLYPDKCVSKTPSETFTFEMASNAIKIAEQIYEFVQGILW